MTITIVPYRMITTQKFLIILLFLVNLSNYSSYYSNVASSHSNSTSTLSHHDIHTHANFEILLLLAHNKQTFKTKCSKYFHTSICKCVRIYQSTSSHTRLILNTQHVFLNIYSLLQLLKILILDTGATQHISGDIEIFLTLTMQLMFPFNQVVVFVDGSTT